MYVVGAVLLAVGEAIALAKYTDSQEPITYYVREFFKRPGPIGLFICLGLWLWLGCHFLAYEWVSC
jgi:hypothetical protein